MSDLETLKAEIKKLSAKATQAKMDLHDLSEELPLQWETIPPWQSGRMTPFPSSNRNGRPSRASSRHDQKAP